MIQTAFDPSGLPVPVSKPHRGHPTLGCASGAIVLALVAQFAAFAQTAPRETVAAVRQRATRTPSTGLVHVRGIVTVSDGRRGLLFVQDDSGGVFVTPSPPAPAMAGGEVVAVSGRAVMTGRGPAIVDARLAVTGRGPRPAAQPLSSLGGRVMAADARLIAVEGVVRGARVSPGGVEATIRTPEGTLTLLQPAGSRAEQTPVDAIVRVDGVLSHVMDDGRSVGHRELIATAPVVIISAPPAEPFQAAELAVSELRRQPPGNELVRRGRVSGVVTRQRLGRSLHLRTPTGPMVLLAEDDRPVRRLVVTELGRRGFTVLDAEDGRAALDLFLQHRDTIDIVVTDVVMPRMNGADLAKEVEKIRPGVKVLFISGHPERAGSGLDPTGATNLLMKPFTADTLAARIKEMITGKQEGDGWHV